MGNDTNEVCGAAPAPTLFQFPLYASEESRRMRTNQHSERDFICLKKEKNPFGLARFSDLFRSLCVVHWVNAKCKAVAVKRYPQRNADSRRIWRYV